MYRSALKMILATSLWLAGIAVFAAPQAGACSCAEPPPLTEDVARRTAIFSGTVLEIVKPERGAIASSGDPVYVRFSVDTAWKGVDATQVIVTTASGGETCGYEGFELGRAYVVFASGSPERLETGLCTRTAPLEQAGETLAGLGEGVAPVKQADLTLRAPEVRKAHLDEAASGEWRTIGYTVAALAFAIALIGVWKRRAGGDGKGDRR